MTPRSSRIRIGIAVLVIIVGMGTTLHMRRFRAYAVRAPGAVRIGGVRCERCETWRTADGRVRVETPHGVYLLGNDLSLGNRDRTVALGGVLWVREDPADVPAGKAESWRPRYLRDRNVFRFRALDDTEIEVTMRGTSLDASEAETAE